MSLRDTAIPLLGVEIVLLALLALSYPTLTPGTAPYVVAKLSAGVILVTIALLSAFIYTGWDPT